MTVPASAATRQTLRDALIGIAVGLFLAGLLLILLAPQPEPRSAVGGAVTLHAVVTQRVRAVPVRSRVEIAGILEARRRVQLFAETRGPVIEVGAEELDRVEAGALLVKIDPLLAEVSVERAEAAVARHTSELSLAHSHLKRRRSLAEHSAASASDLDDAISGEKVAAADLREARAELKLARDDLTKKTIRALFAGVLRTFRVEVGEYVREGQQIGELLDLSTARTTIGLSDREIVAVRAGDPATVRVEVYSGEIFTGSILRVGAASEPVSKKFPVEIELPNADGRLLPGMVAVVILDIGSGAARTVIPRDATVDQFGLRFVYVVEDDGNDLVAVRRRVVVGLLPFRPSEFEVISGLAEGDEIVVSGARQLGKRTRVRRNGSSPP